MLTAIGMNGFGRTTFLRLRAGVLLLWVLGLGLSPMAKSQENLISNGSFEIPAVVLFDHFGVPSGWSLDWHGSGGCALVFANAFPDEILPATHGQQVALLYPTTVLSTYINLVAGNDYKLNFDFSSDQLNRLDTRIQIGISDAVQNQTTSYSIDPLTPNWAHQAIVFTAQNTAEYRISFTTHEQEYVFLDDVTLTQIPEPTASSLLVLGSALRLLVKFGHSYPRK